MLLGFAAELYWHGSVFWMTDGGLAGGGAGALGDTALFFYALALPPDLGSFPARDALHKCKGFLASARTPGGGGNGFSNYSGPTLVSGRMRWANICVIPVPE